jgi:hypothetical protein
MVCKGLYYNGELITQMVETNGSLTKTTVLMYDDEQRLISAASNFETQSFFTMQTVR